MFDTKIWFWDSSHTHRNKTHSHMRTKTLLLTAALAAVGVSSSMAQVYSVNAVGYINLSIPHGFSIVGNQLNATPNNQVQNVFGTLPQPTTLYVYNNSTG